MHDVVVDITVAWELCAVVVIGMRSICKRIGGENGRLITRKEGCVS